MEPNVVLWWCAIASAVALLFASVRGRPWRRDWLLVAVLVGGLAVVERLLWAPFAGWVTGAAWVALVVLPGVLNRRLGFAMLRQDWRAARRAARWLRRVHPSADVRETELIVESLACAAEGRVDAARALLSPRVADTPAGRQAHVLLRRIDQAWDSLAAELGALDTETLRSEPGLVTAWARALGETGERAGVVALAQRWLPAMRSPMLQPQRDQLRLYLFAFTGRLVETERLLEARFPVMSAELRAFWRATAAQISGDATTAEGLFATIPADADAQVRRDFEWRRTRGPFTSAPVPDEAAVVEEARRGAAEDERFAMPAPGRRTPAPVTWTIAAVLVLVFALEEWFGGSTDGETLYVLGAYWAPAVLEGGEWWRVLTYQLLHAGFLHLSLNVLALLVLGPGIERALGRVRFLATYLAAGTAGGVLATLVAWLGWRDPQLVVGASGGIMGLIGALVAVLLRGHLRHRSVIAKQRLLAALAIVALQTAFDLATPQVSLFAHASGLVTGFLFASLLRHPGLEEPPGERR